MEPEGLTGVFDGIETGKARGGDLSSGRVRCRFDGRPP